MDGPRSSRTFRARVRVASTDSPTSGHDQVGHLDVDAPPVEVRHRLPDRLRTFRRDVLAEEAGLPAALEIDADRVEVGSEQLGRFGGHVPVRHEVGEEARGPGLLHHVKRVLDEDRGFVVGERHAGAPVPERGGDGVRRGEGSPQDLLLLGDLGVLAVQAAPVAPDRADRKDPGARMEVGEGFLLDRVDLRRGGLPVR